MSPQSTRYSEKGILVGSVFKASKNGRPGSYMADGSTKMRVSLRLASLRWYHLRIRTSMVVEDCAAGGKRLGGGSSRCNEVLGGRGNDAEID